MDLNELQARLAAASTHQQWVNEVARFFRAHELGFGHGTETAEDEAYWLIRHLQGWAEEAWQAPPDEQGLHRVLELAGRRVVERKPLAYLLGTAWFAGLEFKVDERVLIPRSPLAEVTERGFRPWVALRPGERVLDLGTGSGCIAVASAHYCPQARVYATDVCAEALAVAAENVARHGLQDRIALIQTDLFAALKGRFGVIVSNPPYVAEQRLAQLPAEYGREPRVALHGGRDGLAVVERILRAAGEYLRPGGVLLVEVGEAADALIRAHPRLPCTWLELERGGEGVFVLTREELAGYLNG